jgi:hypothetical protein
MERTDHVAIEANDNNTGEMNNQIQYYRLDSSNSDND